MSNPSRPPDDALSRVRQLYAQVQHETNTLETTQQEAREQIGTYLSEVIPLLQNPMVNTTRMIDYKQPIIPGQLFDREFSLSILTRFNFLSDQHYDHRTMQTFSNNGSKNLFTGYFDMLYSSHDNSWKPYLHYIRAAEASNLTDEQFLELLQHAIYPHSQNEWQRSINPHNYFKEVEVEDFVQQPTLFSQFQSNVEYILQQVPDLIRDYRTQIHNNIGLDTLRQTVSDTEDVSPQDLPQFARGIATAMMATPRLIEATRDVDPQQATELLAIAIEERAALIQETRSQKALPTPIQQGQRREVIVDADLSPTIDTEIVQIANNDTQVEQKVRRLIRRGYQDPKRIFDVAKKILIELVPKAKLIITILEAVDELFSPIDQQD